MKNNMQDQELELLEGYRQLKPESKRFVMSTVITAVTAESVIKRQYGLPAENSPVRAVSQFSDGEVN
jgi:hypothetical protein